MKNSQISSAIRCFFPLPNNPNNLNPSCKINIYFWNICRGKTLSYSKTNVIPYIFIHFHPIPSCFSYRLIHLWVLENSFVFHDILVNRLLEWQKNVDPSNSPYYSLSQSELGHPQRMLNIYAYSQKLRPACTSAVNAVCINHTWSWRNLQIQKEGFSWALSIHWLVQSLCCLQKPFNLFPSQGIHSTCSYFRCPNI